LRHSTILPLYMFDFWSLPYLRGGGLDADTVRAFARCVQPLLVAGLRSDAGDLTALEAQLTTPFQAHSGTRFRDRRRENQRA
jgi:hypothetical protein